VAGRRARRAAGRHFLASKRLAETLVGDAGISRRDLVVEIGAGSGRLTVPLAASAARVLAVELDGLLAAELRRRFAGTPHVTVVEGDALRVPLPPLPFRVVGNLPFAHTTAILRRLLEDPVLPLDRADVIVQWEVARKRVAIFPSTLLGVVWSARWELALERRLPASCFEPPPQVDAGVLRIVRRERSLVPAAELSRFAEFVRGGFDGRPLWHGAACKRTLRQLGLGPGVRPSDLDAHAWAAVFGAVRRTL
jgi:23S rRNA (adenine-N6)-dimethyltransferase